MTPERKQLLGAAAFILVLVVAVYAAQKKEERVPPAVACPADAKMCPDGTTVGRSGPNCEFAKCPEPAPETEGWVSFSDPIQGIAFKYPDTLATTYIHTVDWPPKVAITSGPFTCADTGTDIPPTGKVESKTVNGRAYCVTSSAEGAAGSTYITYRYAFPRGETVPVLTFSIREVQCGNYPETERAACDAERTSFSIDAIADAIAQTLTVTQKTVEELPSGTIVGSVLLGPTCPVVRNPPDPECADKPFATRLALTSADGVHVVKEFSSDASGSFTLEASPGEYAIRSAAAANVLPYCATTDTVRVSANEATRVAVSCDTGIR